MSEILDDGPAQVDIRPMNQADVEGLARAFASMNKTQAQYERYWTENQQDVRVTLVAQMEQRVVGYANVIWASRYEPFKQQDVPEINDLNVVAEFRKRGIGTALIRACEAVARDRGKSTMGIGVGVTEDYAAAQRLYPRLGYVYDERGVHPDEWGGAEYLTKGL